MPTTTLHCPSDEERSPPSPAPEEASSSRREPLLLHTTTPSGSSTKPYVAVLASSSHSSRHSFLRHAVWPGLGLLGESYMLFSLGILTPLWQLLFPECYYDTDTSASASCGPLFHQHAAGITVSGLILGMCGMGYMGQQLGRRRGSIVTASFMALGGTGMLTVALCSGNENDSSSAPLWNGLTLALFILGLGVGGEYPLSAASASERAMEEARTRALWEEQQQQTDGLVKETTAEQPHQQHHRGRHVQLVFSMQGAGIFLNTFLLTVLLYVTQQRTDEYNVHVLLMVWQITYAVGALLLVTVLLTRVALLQESTVWARDQQAQQQQQTSAAQLLQQQRDMQSNSPPKNPTESPPTKTRYADPQQIASPIAMVSSVSSLSAPSVVAVPFEHDRPLPDVPEHDLLQSPLSPSSALFHDPNGCCQRVALPWTSPTWQLVRRHYGMRLLGASLSWFLWDIAFYGNKLFQSTFLLALTGGSESTTLLVFALAATLNAGVALLGYFGAAHLLDWVGRKQLQQWGFLLTGTLFVGVGFLLAEPNNNDDNEPKKPSVPLLVCMYLGTSFFGQLGPNATTFLIPAEIVPTELRTLGHGIAAASGKLGALVASLVFARLDQDLTMFLLSGYASFVACAVTYWTLPETASLDLYEHDKKWRLIRLGRGHEYDGAANHPHHLSVYERYTRQRHEQERHGLRMVGHEEEHAYWHHSGG